MACNCRPQQNLVCVNQGSGDSNNRNNITIAQPTCVILPDSSMEENPYFDATDNYSYWSYKIVVSCTTPDDFLPTNIYFPLYTSIEQDSVTVTERIVTCGSFNEVPFTFENPSGITPPEGFKYLSIAIDNRYTNSISAVYILRIKGSYPTTSQPIYVNTNDTGVITYEGDFLIPGEPLMPRIAISKASTLFIADNQASADYVVTISNTGNTMLENIQYTDTVNYLASNITIGMVTALPEDIINVDTSTPGTVRLTGNIPNLNPGENFVLSYNIPITSISTPDTYSFTSNATVTSNDINASVSDDLLLEAVSFTDNILCSTNTSGEGVFTIALESIQNSPESEIIVNSLMTIPSGITVRFTDFSNCTAVFSGTENPVPLNMDITDSIIAIRCDVVISPRSTTNIPIRYTITRSMVSGSQLNLISYEFDSLTLANPSTQVLLNATPIPDSNGVEIGIEAEC